MLCSALEDESRGNRENPESNGLDLITERGEHMGFIRMHKSLLRDPITLSLSSDDITSASTSTLTQ